MLRFGIIIDSNMHDVLAVFLSFGEKIFRSILPKVYNHRFLKLVRVAHASLSERTKRGHLPALKKDCCSFFEEYLQLYTLRQMSQNVHHIRHLALSIEDCGIACNYWPVVYVKGLLLESHPVLTVFK
jgi:hypothetical protein